ncbi:hypothetical protein ACFSKW_27060 [Nonomuraea mangrovi]|uniref:Uncharacterized protein n=1 Tax=Nonomuraea mangrovi TaxID=2316207 RepID=A0ABW4T1N7_9ACTN
MFCHSGDSFDGFGVEGDSDQGDPDPVVVADLQVKGREELALQGNGEVGEPGLEQGDHVKQLDLMVSGGRVRLDLGELMRLGSAVVLQLREARLQAA